MKSPAKTLALVLTNVAVSRLLFVLLLGTALVYHLSARLSFQSAVYQLPYEPTRGLRSADPALVNAAVLNYTTVATDLIWISTIINHATLRSQSRENRHLIEIGFSLAHLDPRFYRTYTWFPAAFLTRNTRPTEAEMKRLDDLIMIGAGVYPQDFYLPYSAGLNYIGYSHGASKKRRIREMRRGRDLMAMAMTLPGAHNLTQGVYSWFQRRIRQLEGKDISPALVVESQLQLLGQAHIPLIRESAIATLREYRVSEQYIARWLNARTAELLQRQEADGYGYMDHELWLLVGEHD